MPSHIPQWAADLHAKMDHFHDHLRRLEKEIKQMSAELDRTIASVQKLESAVDGMVELLGTLSGLIRDAGDSTNVKAALTKLADEVDAKAQAAADAIVANTPAANPPVEPPPAP